MKLGKLVNTRLNVAFLYIVLRNVLLPQDIFMSEN